MAEALPLQSSSILGTAGMSRARGVLSPPSQPLPFTLADVVQRGGVGKDLWMSCGKWGNAVGFGSGAFKHTSGLLRALYMPYMCILALNR